MMKTKILILVMLISALPVTNIFAQAKAGKLRELEALENIKKLHEGVLLVRLSTKNNAINAYRKAGYTERANFEDSLQTVKNKKIINAFKKQFTFCPVYFFTSDYTQNIKQGELDKVVFVDGNLMPDKSVNITGKLYLTAEFADIEQDSMQTSFNALIIKDAHLKQLQRPFPFFMKTYDGMPFGIKRKPVNVVRKMNENLQNFYTHGVSAGI